MLSESESAPSPTGPPPTESAALPEAERRAAAEAMWSLLQEPPGAWRTWHLATAIAKLDAKQCEEALLATRRLGRSPQAVLIPLLFSRWHSLDPRGLERFAAPSFKLMCGSRDSSWHVRIGSEFALLEPLAAEAASKGGISSTRGLYLTLLGMKKWKRDTAAGVFVEPPRFSDPRLFESATASFAGDIAKLDPEAALRYAMQAKAHHNRHHAFGSIFREWMERDPATATARLSAAMRDTADSPQAREVFSSAFAGKQGVEAVMEAEESPESSATTKAGAAAIAGALQLPEGWQRDAALDGAFGKWSKEAPLAALEWSLANNALADDGRSQADAIERAMKKDRDAALKLLDGIQDDELRAQLLHRAMVADLENNGPPDSIAMLPPEWQAQAAEDYSKKTKAAAKGVINAILPHFPPGDAREKIIEGIAANQDETGAYLAQFTDAADRDAALLGIGLKKAADDPAAAVETLSQIADPARRQRAFFLHAQTWLRRDEKAARTWLDTTPELPEPTKQFLRAQKVQLDAANF